MKSESLQALIIDQQAGELLPEVVELLEAHLANDPISRKEADRIRLALEITSQTVVRHPELVRFVERVPTTEGSRPMPKSVHPFLKAAAALVFACLTAAAGFQLGRNQSIQVTAESAAERSATPIPRKDSPWARYRMAIDPKVGGIQVVRVDLTEREEQP